MAAVYLKIQNGTQNVSFLPNEYLILYHTTDANDFIIYLHVADIKNPLQLKSNIVI